MNKQKTSSKKIMALVLVSAAVSNIFATTTVNAVNAGNAGNAGLVGLHGLKATIKQIVARDEEAAAMRGFPYNRRPYGGMLLSNEPRSRVDDLLNHLLSQARNCLGTNITMASLESLEGIRIHSKCLLDQIEHELEVHNISIEIRSELVSIQERLNDKIAECNSYIQIARDWNENLETIFAEIREILSNPTISSAKEEFEKLFVLQDQLWNLIRVRGGIRVTTAQLNEVDNVFRQLDVRFMQLEHLIYHPLRTTTRC